jgi:iron complex transport system ATP-binding protein
MSLLEMRDLSVSLGGRPVIRHADLAIGAGEVVGLIGPNGAGKTTLMRAALGLIPASGKSTLAALDETARARAVAWMPQDRHVAWPVAVEALVGLGRLPHRRWRALPTADDHRIVADALRQVGLAGFEHRPATELSAGERTRALIARALAQQAPLIMADEPIAGLDPAHQMSTMQTFCDLAGQGRSVFLSIHDLGLAARYCTRLVLVGEQGIAADGPPGQVLTREHLARIFGIEAHLSNGAEGPVFQPLRVLGP